MCSLLSRETLVKGRMNLKMDGWVDGWRDGEMDRWIDGVLSYHVELHHMLRACGFEQARRQFKETSLKQDRRPQTEGSNKQAAVGRQLSFFFFEEQRGRLLCQP